MDDRPAPGRDPPRNARPSTKETTAAEQGMVRLSPVARAAEWRGEGDLTLRQTLILAAGAAVLIALYHYVRTFHLEADGTVSRWAAPVTTMAIITATLYYANNGGPPPARARDEDTTGDTEPLLVVGGASKVPPAPTSGRVVELPGLDVSAPHGAGLRGLTGTTSSSSSTVTKAPGSAPSSLSRASSLPVARDPSPQSLRKAHSQGVIPTRDPERPSPVPPPLTWTEGGAPVPLVDVLLVEDTPTNVVVARKFLALIGHVPTVAGNGLEAVQFVEARLARVLDQGAPLVPLIVLMDLHMPVMDGMTATVKIREEYGRTSLRQPVIVAITADAGSKELCLATHFDDFLSKPLLLSHFKQQMRAAVAKATSPAA